MTDRRNALLDAAIDVVGTHGVRALTHRRVDEFAGLAPGSASNVFRTRRALVEGVLDRLVERDLDAVAAVTGSTTPATTAECARILADFVVHAVGPDAARSRARIALFVEAAGDGVGAAIERRREALREVLAAVIAPLGVRPADAAARALSDHLDGAILHRLTGQPVRRDELADDLERALGSWTVGRRLP